MTTRPPPEFGASFNLSSLVCDLLTHDIASSTTTLDSLGDNLNEMYSEDGIRSLLASFGGALRNMPPELMAVASDQLFHERLHYWQLLGYPILHWRYLHQLELLRMRLPRERSYLYAGLNAGLPPGDQGSVEESIELFGSHIRFDPDVVGVPDEVQPEDGRSTRLAGGELTVGGLDQPVAVAVVRGLDGGTRRFAMDAVHLLEGAVAVSELVAGLKQERETEELLGGPDVDYWVAWIVWNEASAPHDLTTDEKRLTFLAAVDLALCGDVAWFLDLNQDQAQGGMTKLATETAVSVRFAKICQAFSVVGGQAATVLRQPTDRQVLGVSLPGLAALQHAMAQATGVLPIDEVCGRDLTRLTRTAGTYLYLLEAGVPPDVQRAFDRIANLPIAEWASVQDDCGLIWAAISEQYPESIYDIVGFSALATMCNFMFDRRQRPLDHLIPMSSFPDMIGRFGLPLINFKGTPMYDATWLGDPQPSRPISSILTTVARDLFQTVPLMPIAERNDSDTCGFIRHNQAMCSYEIAGFGCPLLGLSEAEVAVRAEFSLGDGCFWTRARDHAGLSA